MSDPSTGRVPPGAALDRIVEKFIDGALACAELTQADVERGGGLTALSWAVVRLELAYQYAGRLLEIEALRAALDAQPPQAPQKKTPCDRCFGTGYIPSETCEYCVDCQDQCPLCKGSGVAEGRRAQEHPQ